MQAWARGFMASKRARERFQVVVFLQRAVRSWLLILAAKRLLEELRRKMQEEVRSGEEQSDEDLRTQRRLASARR